VKKLPSLVDRVADIVGLGKKTKLREKMELPRRRGNVEVYSVMKILEVGR